MKKKRKRKVIRYRRRTNAALVVFGIIFIYILCFVIMYATKKKIDIYEVEAGNMTNSFKVTGVALRSEKVYYSQYSGNIDYYQREGSRVKTNDTIYSVDETGHVSEILSQYSNNSESSLSKSQFESMQLALNNFKTYYEEDGFTSVYDLKDDLNSIILTAMKEKIAANLDSIIKSTGSQNVFKTINSSTAGIVEYFVDGYENVTTDNFTYDKFDQSNYNKNSLKNTELVLKDSPVFKMIDNEEWNIMIPLTKQQIDEYQLSTRKSITIKFDKDNISTTAAFSIINKDNQYYGKIDIDKYLIRYAGDRFLTINIILSSSTGLKIPSSAIVNNDFYVIPKDYLTTNGVSKTQGFFMATGDGNGHFVSPDIYKITDTSCYVKTSDLTSGSTLMKMDSSDTFIVGEIEKLQGVYCVNSGYTQFRIVDTISTNNEYYVVKRNVSLGVSLYDRIVLNPEGFSENQMIY